MHLTRYTFSTAIFIFLSFTVLPGFGQLGFSFNIKKPSQFDDRVLASEKSEDKKFTLTDRFVQNTFTHYNYFFNAKNKLNEIIELAKSLHIDDYDELLPFYNYSLDITAQNKSELDSVIYKSTTGIVLHDLRNDWIDNLYLLSGVAYYFRKQFDSAYLTFQFINYAFFNKDKDGYYKNIGSNLDGNNALSISTKEKNSLPRKVFSEPPSRNESFIWMIRTLIAQEEYAEAASLIVTLKNDPVFPKRLITDLEEIQALWFYNNNMPDSAALHLSNALENATTKNEKARWEFLIAQLYEMSNNPEMAKTFFDKVTRHTSDPVMEMYARLHSIRANKNGNKDNVDQNIAELLKMAGRDRYSEYRDIIYYTLAQMEAERGNLEAAQGYLAKSTAFNTSNPALKNKAWLQFAELAFSQKKYVIAHNCYDSIDLNDPALRDVESITYRKNLLAIISSQIQIIERQDSLQKIAALPEEERKDLVRKITRKLRKEQGLKEEPATLIPIGDKNQVQQQTDLFTNTSAKGEWYFYNATLRTKGFTEFKAKWGNRANADNWRRSAGISMAQNNKPVTVIDSLARTGVPQENGEINFDALYEKLPLTKELLKISNDSVSAALYLLGNMLSDELEDCSSTIQTYEELRNRFPDHEKMSEVLFKLYYCYTKSGQLDKAAAIKKLMSDKYADNPLTAIVLTGKDPRDKTKNPDATKAYEHIYNLFIEGDFTKAIEEKAKADDQFGTNYWTPQLLYIETVYYIKQKQDDKAYETLGNIIRTFPGTPIAEKAITLSQVLSRRKEIEDELSKLNVERPKEAAPVKMDTLVTKTAVKPDTAIVQSKQQAIAPPVIPPVAIVPKKDSVKLVETSALPYVFNPADNYAAMVILNKVDMVWANETKNAFNLYNRNKYYNRQFDLNVIVINGEYKALLVGAFENAQTALDYMHEAKKVSASQIIPWLTSEKYSFSIISTGNLELLKSLQDVNSYKQFIEKSLPGKF